MSAVAPAAVDVVLCQGERDAQAIGEGKPVTGPAYQDALERLVAALQADLPDHLPDHLPTVYLRRLGAPNSGDTADWQTVRAAQAAAVSSASGLVMGDTSALALVGSMYDELHYTRAQNAAALNAAALANVSAAMGCG